MSKLVKPVGGQKPRKSGGIVARKTAAVSGDEKALYHHIRDLIVAARQTVARGVDLVQVWTNFEIGRHIVEHEQRGKERAVYGAEVLTRLSEKLTGEFGRGYAKRSLEYMRKFFLMYKDRIAQSAIGKLPPGPLGVVPTLSTAGVRVP